MSLQRHWVWVALLWAVSGWAQELPPDLALIARIRVRMDEVLNRLPNYTCVQTIERSVRHAPRRNFSLVDTVRLEVAMVDNREMFAWPGSKKFSDKDISDLVGGGAIGNGNFGLLAKAVFLTNAARYTYGGEVTLRDRPAHRFDYVVPLLNSGYSIRVPPNSARVGFHGQFWIDRETLDLMRLEVYADDIPPEIGLSETSDFLEYERVPIGDHEFLLPRGSELRMVDLHGNTSLNRVKFSGCRQYFGESVVSFLGEDSENGGEGSLAEADEPADSSSVSAAATRTTPEVRHIRAGSILEMEITKAIELKETAGGDPVEAVLTKAVKHGRTVLFPKGARVQARIVQLVHRHAPFEHLLAAMEIESVESEGATAEFVSTMLEAGPSTGLITDHRDRFPGVSPPSATSRMRIVESPKGLGYLFWRPSLPQIPKGFRMSWRVEGPRTGDTK
jgi:hypothetical protein